MHNVNSPLISKYTEVQFQKQLTIFVFKKLKIFITN